MFNSSVNLGRLSKTLIQLLVKVGNHSRTRVLSWVRIPEQDTGWTFFTLICCKICIVCTKRPNVNRKEAEDCPFFKVGDRTNHLSLFRGDQQKQLVTISDWSLYVEIFSFQLADAFFFLEFFLELQRFLESQSISDLTKFRVQILERRTIRIDLKIHFWKNQITDDRAADLSVKYFFKKALPTFLFFDFSSVNCSFVWKFTDDLTILVILWETGRK